MSQLKRDYMALSHIPSIVTVLTADGRVVHQNGGSLGWGFGWLVGRLGRVAQVSAVDVWRSRWQQTVCTEQIAHRLMNPFRKTPCI
jgi:hypothetical protein